MLTLKSNASGTDHINIDMIMLTMPDSLTAITAIVNKSIQTAIFPSHWKVALITPIPKVNNPMTVKELRPVSILPCLSKVLERVIYIQMNKYLEHNNILPDAQSGFRKCRSTTTALLDVVDNVLVAQDSGMGTALTLLDFSRAFDTINIPLLLSKLSFYGFDHSAVAWFNS